MPLLSRAIHSLLSTPPAVSCHAFQYEVCAHTYALFSRPNAARPAQAREVAPAVELLAKVVIWFYAIRDIAAPASSAPSMSLHAIRRQAAYATASSASSFHSSQPRMKCTVLYSVLLPVVSTMVRRAQTQSLVSLPSSSYHVVTQYLARPLEVGHSRFTIYLPFHSIILPSHLQLRFTSRLSPCL